MSSDKNVKNDTRRRRRGVGARRTGRRERQTDCTVDYSDQHWDLVAIDATHDWYPCASSFVWGCDTERNRSAQNPSARSKSHLI
jgi:hypothetical protein